MLFEGGIIFSIQYTYCYPLLQINNLIEILRQPLKFNICMCFRVVCKSLKSCVCVWYKALYPLLEHLQETPVVWVGLIFYSYWIGGNLKSLNCGLHPLGLWKSGYVIPLIHTNLTLLSWRCISAHWGPPPHPRSPPPPKWLLVP